MVGDNVLYYAVDHSPSLPLELRDLGDQRGAASLPPTVLGGPDAWDADPTVRRAIEIRDGVIQNPAILSFQGRAPKYPHWPLAL